MFISGLYRKSTSLLCEFKMLLNGTQHASITYAIVLHCKVLACLAAYLTWLRCQPFELSLSTVLVVNRLSCQPFELSSVGFMYT